MEKKMLLVVDPQIDFIEGTLPVPGAAEAMDALAGYVRAHGDEYAVKVVTSDWHPYRHCSFDREGGPWPAHCIRHSAGAAVWQSLLAALEESRGGYTMLYKGDRIDREEYSIMQNPQSSAALLQIISALGIERVDICGLAGNVCVLNTVTDLKEAIGADKIHVLEQYSPSLDGGVALAEFVAGLAG